MLLSSFPPLVAPNAAVLILGSMPGQMSLRQQQYYAHPHNHFWRIMGDLVGVSPALPYEERTRRLTRAGVALWDSLKHCERPGSLDASIVAETEVPNDFATLLAGHPAIGAICFNGQKSEQAFRRHALPGLPDALIAGRDLIRLPSTSPANARLTYEQKLARWRVILDYLPTPLAGHG